jgi:hypothetical protein
MAEIKPKLKISVNKNPTKEGIKVQFMLPQAVEGDEKAKITQKLQSKLNQGLSQYNLTINQDTDTPYANVIGFLIPIADIKLLIKNAIGGGQAAPEEAPAEETPAPEEPMKEIKRMQKLAGVKESQLDEFGGYGFKEGSDEDIDFIIANKNTPAFKKAFSPLERINMPLNDDELRLYIKANIDKDDIEDAIAYMKTLS